jgi:hopanoid-associated phosphorylase
VLSPPGRTYPVSKLHVAAAAALSLLAFIGCSKSGGGGGVPLASTASTTPASTTSNSTPSPVTSTTTAPPSTAATTTTTPAANLPVLVVVGLQQEQQIAQGPNVVICLSASDPNLLRQRISLLKPTDYKAVVSFGVCGGLLPGFNDGDLMLATKVVLAQGTGTWTPDANLTTSIVKSLAATGMAVRTGVFAGSDSLAASNSAALKAALRAATGADEVDMETHIAAQFAASGNVPFVAMRSPSDDYSQALPPAAMVPLNQDGSTNYGAVILNVIQNPWQIPDLFTLNQNTNAALDTLKKARTIVDLGGL